MNNQQESYKHELKNGETIVFLTDMPIEEVMTLSLFSNQYEFLQYFNKKNYWLSIECVIKKI